MSPFDFQFMQHALLAGLLASVACGVVGAYVVVKRIALISGGIAHASLGGIGAALFFGVSPLLGAAVFSLGAAALIGLIRLTAREQEDTLIGALWAGGMALGVILMQHAPGSASIEGYLFGNILLVSTTDLIVAACLDIFILATVALFYKEFLAITLDEEFAWLRGLPVTLLYIVLLCLVALTVVVLIRVVGIILLIALLTLPAAMGRWFTRRLPALMFAAFVLGTVFTTGGVFISFYTDFPAGASIVLLASGVYAAGILLRRVSLRRRLRAA